MAAFEATSTDNPVSVDQPTMAAPPLGALRRALGAISLWYDAFAEGQEMASQAKKRRPILRE